MKNLFKNSFFILFLLFSGILYSSEVIVVRFNRPTQEILKEFTNERYDIASYKPGVYLDLLVSEETYQRLVARGFQLEITQTESQMRENMVTGRPLEGYRTYEDMLAELQQLEIDHPDLCKLYDIGDTRGKEYADAGNSNYDNYYHEIWALKLSDNVEVEEDEPCVLYVGVHHAREAISLEVVMGILYHLLENYNVDPDLTDNIDNTQIWFVPLLNPNGHKIVTDEESLVWRKNIRDNDESGDITPIVSSQNCMDGVDLNRNYGFSWGFVGNSSICNTWHFPGPGPWSEPEIKAVKSLLDSHQFVTAITYHSYGEFICSPYGYCQDIMTPDQAALDDLMWAMADIIGYDAYAGIELSPISGLFEDYAYGRNGTFGYTIEVATQFIPPVYQIDNICDDNLGPALLLLDRVNQATLTGHITDADSAEPMVAEVAIAGIDGVGEFRYPYISNEMYGTYYRLLTEGNYNVTFSSYGYVPQSFDNININSSDLTVLDAALEPQPATYDISGIVTEADSGSPVGNALVEILDIGIEPVTTNINGEYEITGIYPYSLEFKVYAEGFIVHKEEIEVSNDNQINLELYEASTEGFETDEFGPDWTMSGNIEWILDDANFHSGNYSARSGEAGNNDYTILSVTCCVEEAGDISFYRMVDSEHNYDYFRFQIDNQLQGEWSGNHQWAYFSYRVSPGIHTFSWSYIKDYSVSAGLDCAWIDDITFPGAINAEDLLLPEPIITLQNYPNPFNPETVISFQVSSISSQDIELSIYNIKGQQIRQYSIFNNQSSITWDGKNDYNQPVSSGIYFYQLKAGKSEKIKKMVLLK